jgi:hypothetical protein
MNIMKCLILFISIFIPLANSGLYKECIRGVFSCYSFQTCCTQFPGMLFCCNGLGSTCCPDRTCCPPNSSCDNKPVGYCTASPNLRILQYFLSDSDPSKDFLRAFFNSSELSKYFFTFEEEVEFANEFSNLLIDCFNVLFDMKNETFKGSLVNFVEKILARAKTTTKEESEKELILQLLSFISINEEKIKENVLNNIESFEELALNFEPNQISGKKLGKLVKNTMLFGF